MSATVNPPNNMAGKTMICKTKEKGAMVIRERDEAGVYKVSMLK